VCMILELAPYRRRRYFIYVGSGMARIALLMVDKVAIVNLRSAFGHREVVRLFLGSILGAGRLVILLIRGCVPLGYWRGVLECRVAVLLAFKSL
jgi:hypothetical protein